MRLTQDYLLALSGGGDSLALLRLAVEAGRPPAAAVIIDHAVRPGSEADAAWAKAQAEALGVSAQVLRLSGAAKTQAAMRRARYAALTAAARGQGLAHIALAHTLDDQAETVLIRAARGSAWPGLAGMAARAPLPLWPEGRGLWLLRPLLGVRRQALRGFLRRRGATWLEDPANAALRFARTRARAHLEATGAAPRFAAIAAEIARFAALRDTAAAACLAATVIEPTGALRLPLARLANAPETVRRRALAVAVAAAAGAERPPRETTLGPLLAAIERGEGGAATLAGARAAVRRGDLILSRDPGAALGRRDGPQGLPPALLTAAPLIWDGRFEVRGPKGAIVRPAGSGADPTRPALIAAGRPIPPESLIPLAAERIAHALWRAWRGEASTFLRQHSDPGGR